jgi:hypothetical protein
MKIVDLYGKDIYVADLRLALLQADDFRHYSTNDPGQLEFVQKQQAYWQDIYDKLLALEQEDG